MKSFKNILCLSVIACALNACDTANGILGAPCSLDSDCLDLVCVNTVCINKCSPTSCDPDQFCNERGVCISNQYADTSECSAAKPCANGLTCSSEGKCVAAQPECSAEKPCAIGFACSNEGKCVAVEPECSAEKPCADGFTCTSEGKCAESGPECSEEKACSNPQKVCNLSTQTCIDRCTATSCENGKICDFSGLCVEKCTATSCGENAICMNGYCIAKCTEDSCNEGEKCGVDGLCYTKCSSTSCPSNQLCSAEGQCVDRCTAESCPETQVCGDSGECITGECSSLIPCKDGRICSNNQCFTVETLKCYEDSDCGEGFGCDKNKCVDANSCSLTRTCVDGKVCRDGACTDPVPVNCDKSHPCSEIGQKCVAGTCVTCNCPEGQDCNVDGTCISSTETDTVKVGDSCVWHKDFTYCDHNRLVSCTAEQGSDDFKIDINDCGASICSTTSEEGVGCHNPCMTESDFYGACVDFYGEYSAFTHVCEMTDNGLVWTLKYGFEDCTSSCKNGRCNFVPPEFGESCTESNYVDACQGRWLTYCYYGYKMGTDCATYSEDHFCALPSHSALMRNPKLVGVCALSCTTPGATHTECIMDEEGNVYSMTYLCAETTDGRLADFEAGFVNCTESCHVETGLCN